GAMCAMQGRAIQDQLGGDNYCFGCGPQNPDGLQIKSYWEGEETVCRFEARPAFAAGPRQLLNGGIIATLIDCHSGCTAMALAYRAEGRPLGSDPPLWVRHRVDADRLPPAHAHRRAGRAAGPPRVDRRQANHDCVLASGRWQRLRARPRGRGPGAGELADRARKRRLTPWER